MLIFAFVPMGRIASAEDTVKSSLQIEQLLIEKTDSSGEHTVALDGSVDPFVQFSQSSSLLPPQVGDETTLEVSTSH